MSRSPVVRPHNRSCMPVTAEHEAPRELFQRCQELTLSLLRQVFHARMPLFTTVRAARSLRNARSCQAVRSVHLPRMA